MGIYTIGSVDEIPQGDVLGVKVNGIEIAIVNANGELYGIQNICLHRGQRLHTATQERINDHLCVTNGPGIINQDERTITCPGHDWKFELETGRNPATGKQMRTFEVTTENGKIQVEV
jgi:nitrite reductase/ring-hydroxylating ferredoxin subunit